MPSIEIRRRGRGLAALLAASALALTACSSSPSTPEKPAESGGATTGKVEVVWPGTSDPEMKLAEDFKAAMAEEGIEIEYNFLSWSDMQKQLTVRIQGGNPPDITALQDVTDMVRLGGLAPLNDRIEKSGIDEANFRPGSLEYSNIDGKQYSLPVIAQAFTLAVNEEMLNDAGYKIEDLKTWDDLEKAAAAMTGNGKYGFAYPLGVARFAFRGALTAGYSNDLNIGEIGPENEKQWRELLTHLKALKDARPAADVAWGYPEMFQAFANGEVGIIPAGTFFTANVYSLNPEIVGKTRQIAYPAGPSGTAQAPVSSMGYGIFAKSSNPELSWKVIEALTSDEWSVRTAAVVNTPASKTVTLDALKDEVAKVYPDATEGHLAQLEDQMKLIDESGTPLKQIPGQPAMETEFQEVILQFLDGKIDLDTAYGYLDERLGKIAESNG